MRLEDLPNEFLSRWGREALHPNDQTKRRKQQDALQLTSTGILLSLVSFYLTTISTHQGPV
jgi:hypothetical protein